MRKRIIIICSISIAILISLIINLNNNSTYTFNESSVTYALTVDGIIQNNFPSKGIYKVETECTNAICKWDYDEWMLRIKNISGDVSCNISFTTISKNYINNLISGFVGKSQGIGSLVHEKFIERNYANATALMQSEYGETSQLEGSEIVTNAFQYNGTEWVSQPDNMTSGKFYHIIFTMPSTGYYQLCYELSSGSTSNKLYLYKGTNQEVVISGSKGSISSSSTNAISGCTDLGNVESGTQYRVIQYAYSTISTLKFSIKRANSTKEIDTGYRYEGENPNNYVWFNNELWRIIGVFDKSSHGQDGLNLVKIVRNESIGGLVWDKSNVNNWNSASLKLLLNNEYLNSTNGTNGENCYGYSTTSKSKCDYRRSGIKDSYRSMIKEVTWYLGGPAGNILTTDEMYGYERNTASINAKVGLMYASDYGYAVPAENCVRSMSMDLYNNYNCTLNNWLYGKGVERTITPISTNQAKSLSLTASGTVQGVATCIGYNVRPTLYLNENVYVLDGTGSESDPYIIGMDEVSE